MKTFDYGLWSLWCSQDMYLRIKEVLEKSGVLKSKFDGAIFYWLSNGKLEKLLCFHVDDFVWGGSINFEKQIINVLKETFSVSSQEFEPFKYLGLYIDQKTMSLRSARCHI